MEYQGIAVYDFTNAPNGFEDPRYSEPVAPCAFCGRLGQPWKGTVLHVIHLFIGEDGIERGATWVSDSCDEGGTTIIHPATALGARVKHPRETTGD